jgi:hypothetical protein
MKKSVNILGPRSQWPPESAPFFSSPFFSAPFFSAPSPLAGVSFGAASLCSSFVGASFAAAFDGTHFQPLLAIFVVGDLFAIGLAAFVISLCRQRMVFIFVPFLPGAGECAVDVFAL